jgi:hypothetical protein
MTTAQHPVALCRHADSALLTADGSHVGDLALDLGEALAVGVAQHGRSEQRGCCCCSAYGLARMRLM